MIGAGHIGTVHAYALQQLADANLVDARLVAAYDEEPKRAERLTRHHGGDPVATLDELLERVDVVWVCTWTAGHLAAVEAAADRGLPIFCEKPLAPTLAECERVAAALSRVPHQVGLVLRWSPVFQHAAARIASGKYGRPLACVMRDDQYFPVQGLYGSTWRGDVRYAGGGTLIEHSIHDIDVLRWLLGDPRDVSARTTSRFGYPGIEDCASVTLTYGDGSMASLTSVWHQVLSRESSRRLEVFCEEGLLWADDDYLGPLYVETTAGTEELTAEPPEWAAAFTVPEVFAKAIAHYATPSKAFLDAIAESGAQAVGHPGADDALAAHRIVDLAYRSADAAGEPMRMTTGILDESPDQR
jgi:predicted dehydrogenase